MFAQMTSAAATSNAIKQQTALEIGNISEFGSPEEMMVQPLWTFDGPGMPREITRAHSVLRTLWANGPYEYWQNWYESQLRGEPLDWGLQKEVALIAPEVWEEGAKAVAEKIREIEDGMSLEQEALANHASAIAREPELYRDVAVSMSMQVETAISTFKDIEPRANCLPPGFEVFELVPSAFSGIADALQPEADAIEIERLKVEISRLHSVIRRLQGELRTAREALRDARLDRVEAEQMRTWGERLNTTLNNVMLIGALGGGLAFFFGTEKQELRYKELKEAVDQLTNDMANAAPAPEVNRPEESDDGPKFQSAPVQDD